MGQTCSLGLWRAVLEQWWPLKTILLGSLYIGTLQKSELRREPGGLSPGGRCLGRNVGVC